MWQILTGGEWYSTCWQPLLTCSTRWRSWRNTCPRCRQRRCGRGACSQKPLRRNPPPADRCPCVPAGRTRAATSSSRLQVVNLLHKQIPVKVWKFWGGGEEEGGKKRGWRMVSRSSHEARLNHGLLLETKSMLSDIQQLCGNHDIWSEPILVVIGWYRRILVSISPHMPDSIRACGCSRWHSTEYSNVAQTRQIRRDWLFHCHRTQYQQEQDE